MKITPDMITFEHRGRTYQIPQNMIDGIEGYINSGLKQGSFLYAVFCNNFVDACLCADYTNVLNLPAYANFLHNYAPIGCYGSAEEVAAWMEARQSASDK